MFKIRYGSSALGCTQRYGAFITCLFRNMFSTLRRVCTVAANGARYSVRSTTNTCDVGACPFWPTLKRVFRKQMRNNTNNRTLTATLIPTLPAKGSPPWAVYNSLFCSKIV